MAQWITIKSKADLPESGGYYFVMIGVDKFLLTRTQLLQKHHVLPNAEIKYLSESPDDKDREIERLKGLIEKVFKATGNKVMAKLYDEDIETLWQQFKTDNNL